MLAGNGVLLERLGGPPGLLTVAGGSAGGILNEFGVLIMNGASTVTENTAGSSGGDIFNNDGTLVGAVAGGNVRNNTPDDIVPI